MLTYNSDAKLAVDGKIKAREIVVIDNPYDWQNWPDFVFKEDYKLKTLQEVENYIKENGKLSDIPSQKEVFEKGINLGEISASLLKKVEELTLYIIEQNKRIKELEEKIKKGEK